MRGIVLFVNVGLAFLLLASVLPATAEAPRRVDVHLFGGDTAAGAPLASWYREIGITDVWLSPVKGAFPQDQRAESQRTARDLEEAGVLEAYRQRQIRYWWLERPVPDVLYQMAKRADAPTAHLWDDSPETEALWAKICQRIAEIYPGVCAAGFAGLAYDNEAYYSFQGDESGETAPWVWAGHASEYGLEGQYYRRGLQVGKAICAAWPKAKVIQVYAFGYEGEVWWYRGFQDAGCEVFLGLEHTYGAGPGDFGHAYYQCWWQGQSTKRTCDWKRTQFTFVADNQHCMAGLFPIDFNAKKANYRARDFRAQLSSASQEDPGGPISVWIWPQGPFTPESWQAIAYEQGESAEAYLNALREFSSGAPAAQPGR